jgi:hypothetical protein
MQRAKRDWNSKSSYQFTVVSDQLDLAGFTQVLTADN